MKQPTSHWLPFISVLYENILADFSIVLELWSITVKLISAFIKSTLSSWGNLLLHWALPHNRPMQKIFPLVLQLSTRRSVGGLSLLNVDFTLHCYIVGEMKCWKIKPVPRMIAVSLPLPTPGNEPTSLWFVVLPSNNSLLSSINPPANRAPIPGSDCSAPARLWR